MNLGGLLPGVKKMRMSTDDDENDDPDEKELLNGVGLASKN